MASKSNHNLEIGDTVKIVNGMRLNGQYGILTRITGAHNMNSKPHYQVTMSDGHIVNNFRRYEIELTKATAIIT